MTDVLDSEHTFGFYVKIGGSFTDLWARYRQGSLRIENEEGAAVDTLSIEIEDWDNSLTLTEWAECYLLVDGTTRHFGGYLVKVKPAAAPGGDTRYWSLRAESYVTLFARSKTIRKTYVNTTIKAIVASLYTLSGLSGFDVATHVDTGPTIALFTAEDEKLGPLLDKLCLLAGEQAAPQTWWTWNVDSSANLVMGAIGSNAAPFGIAAITAADFVTTFPPSGDPDAETDASTIVNRVTVRGGVATAPEVTETFSGDGATVLFSLAHLPVRDIVRITVGGTLQSYGTDWYDAFGGGYDCLVNYAAGTVRWPDVSPPAVGTDNIAVTYRYDDYTTIAATVTDAASYAKYGIYLDAYIQDKAVTSEQIATDLANAILYEYSQGVVEGTFTVERLGLRAGQALTIVYPVLGLDGTYPIRKVTLELDPASTGVRCTVRFGGRADSLSSAVGGGGVGTGNAGGAPYAQPVTPSVNGEVEILRVRDRIEMIDQATTWTSEASPGTAQGWIGLYNPTSRLGKWLGYKAGVLQAYLDSDGTIKWANGYGVLDETGMKIAVSTGYAQARTIRFMDGVYTAGRLWGYLDHAGAVAKGMVLETGTAIDGDAAYITFTTNNSADAASAKNRFAFNAVTGMTASVVFECGSDPAYGGPYIYANGNRIQGVADATADTDALNRQTGDVRYAAIAGAHAAVTLDADAAAILDLSTQEIGLDTQTANTVFAGPSTGAANEPTFRALVAADLPTRPGRTVTDTTTELAADANGIIVCNKGTAMTVNLLAATGSWRRLTIKSIGAGTVTVDADGAETIDGETTQAVSQWNAMTLVDYGSGTWCIV